jgi:hypothetical protein
VKELSGTTFNLVLVKDEDKIVPMVELIIVLSEIQYGLAGEKTVEKKRVPETVRMFTKLSGVKHFITFLHEVEKAFAATEESVTEQAQSAIQLADEILDTITKNCTSHENLTVFKKRLAALCQK